MECEQFHADAAWAESSLQVQVRELHEVESVLCAERWAAEHMHVEAHVELLEIQHEMLDMLKELHDQNKDADGDEEEEEKEEEEEEGEEEGEEEEEGKGKGKGKGKAKE
jgi:hypothetical protein